MAQQELDWLKGELSRVDQDIKERAKELREATTERESAIIQKDYDRLVEEKKVVRQQMSALQAQLVDPAGATASVPVTEFWNALPHASYDPKDRILRLPAGICWLALVGDDSGLYVRKCYEDLWNIIKDLFAKLPQGKRRLLLSGTPGIGKTFFLFYMLYKLACSDDDTAIVLDLKSSTKRYLFHRKQAFVGGKSAFEEELDRSSTFFLVDAMTPPKVPAMTILTTSPRKDVWREYVKYPATRRNMNTWTKEEILAAEPLYGIGPQRATELFDRWGGVPRYVLEGANDDSVQKMLTDAIGEANLEWLLKSVAQTESMPEVTHRLLHVGVAEDYINTSMEFASEYVGRLCGDAFARENAVKLGDFLDLSARRSELGGIRGILFERYWHRRVLLMGGKFEMRDLEEDVDMPPLELPPPVKEFSFTSLDDVAQQEDGTYCIPTSQTFDDIDALLQPDIMFQCTVSASHPASAAGVNNGAKAMRTTGDVSLVFVVPPERFANFRKQVIKGRGFSTLKRVKQRVLKLPLRDIARRMFCRV